jgi:DNA polymerase-3 subunit alpha (Gram-positive type)
VNNPPFKEVFAKVGLPPELLNSLAQTEIVSVRLDSENRRLFVELIAREVLTEKALSEFRGRLTKRFDISQMLVDVNYIPHDSKLAGQVSVLWKSWLAKNKSPMCKSMLEKASWRMEDTKFILTTTGGSAYILRLKGIDAQIQRFINNRIETPVSVEIETAAARWIPTKLEPVPDTNASINSEQTRSSAALSPSGEPPKQKREKPKPTEKPIRGRLKFRLLPKLTGLFRPLSENFQPDEEILINGRVVSSEFRNIKSGRILVTFDITDQTGSITVKCFVTGETSGELKPLLSNGNSIAVKGKAQFDDYSKEINVMAKELAPHALNVLKRMDSAKLKRVELHLHTQMSSMDAITPAKDYIKRAIEWGHSAIAITDHGVAQAFPEAMTAAEKSDLKVIYGMEAYLVDDLNKEPDYNIKKARYYHAVILVKNQIGLRHLYELISNSHIKHFYRRPRILKSEFSKLREGLIIGTACEAGEFFKAVLHNSPDERINELAEFYDYFEIQPIENNMYLFREGKVSSVQDLMDINSKIVELGAKFSKPVIATCDVHFIDPEDEVYRRIIMAGDGFKDADRQPPLFYRTTDEMLAEFEYLGKEKAFEVVVTNTRLLAEQIEKIKPIPDETFPPHIEGAEEQLTLMAQTNARKIYGKNLPEIVEGRLKRELDSIIKNGFAVMYMIAQKLVSKSNEDGYVVGSRGSVGSSFVATMAGITEVNPLPPHYLCPNCAYSDFDSPETKRFAGGSGCDMPSKVCPACGTALRGEGHDIPFETFLGFDGDKEPDIDLNFSGKYQARAHAYCEELFGEGNVFKAGTIATLADKTAYGYVMKYFERREAKPRGAEINRLKQGCTGIKRTTGQHPGGLMILPRGHSIYEFCPVQRPANDTDSDVTTTHFDYHSISGRLLKLDLLGHDVPTIIRMLYDITGIDPVTVPLNDKKVMSLFTAPDALGVSPEEINCATGSLGLPEFGTGFVRQMLQDTKPTTFAELVRISGLSHGTDVWLNNAADLIRDGEATLKEVIPTRDDIMLFLIRMGVEKKEAFKIMENVRKGKGLTEEETAVMKSAHVPDWYIDSCKRIKYLFPKGHAVAYVMMTVRIGYYKVYYPYSFYAASFSVKAEDFDLKMCQGKDALTDEINRICALGKEATAKDKNKLTIMELVGEMYARGLKFAPLDLYKAASDEFLVTPEGLMPPLCAVQGLGMSVAVNIIEARDNGAFFTIDEFRERTKTNKSVIEILKQNHILDGIPETSQVCLF